MGVGKRMPYPLPKASLACAAWWACSAYWAYFALVAVRIANDPSPRLLSPLPNTRSKINMPHKPGMSWACLAFAIVRKANAPSPRVPPPLPKASLSTFLHGQPIRCVGSILSGGGDIPATPAGRILRSASVAISAFSSAGKIIMYSDGSPQIRLSPTTSACMNFRGTEVEDILIRYVVCKRSNKGKRVRIRS